MQIIDYHYIHGVDDRGSYIAIPELDRYKPSVGQFIKLADLSIVLNRPTAFLYVDGFSVSQAESGIGPTSTGYVPAIKSGSSYILHEWVYTFKNKEHLKHASVINSTCAAGVQALHEASRLLQAGDVEEVLIIGGERTTEDTLRLFSELRIPVVCGDGFFYMRLGNGDMEGKCSHVDDIKWKYAYQRNPFLFARSDLDTLIPNYPVDYVKLHATGSQSNTEAEAGLEGLSVPVRYKNLIGHTQGVSSLLETCILMDDPHIQGTVLVTANGFGGYYGAFTLIK